MTWFWTWQWHLITTYWPIWCAVTIAAVIVIVLLHHDRKDQP